MPDTLRLPFIPKGASHQAFSPDASPVSPNLLLNKRSRSFQGGPRHEGKEDSPLKREGTPRRRDKREEAEGGSPLGAALRVARRSRAFGAVATPKEEAPVEDADTSPVGHALRSIRRTRAFGGQVAEAEADVDDEADDSPLGDSLRALRRAHAFGGAEAAARARQAAGCTNYVDAESQAILIKCSTSKSAVEEESSPLGSALLALRRARAFGGAPAADRAREALTGCGLESEAQVEENSPLGASLRSIRRARAFGGAEAAAHAIAHAERSFGLAA
ncbi:unnamed protein product [Effrenium voratum]|nr:unnamed protein product [Effrenium voratum]